VIANLLADLPTRLVDEDFSALLERPGVRLERIVSTGQATPEGQWLNQPGEEWVLLLSGAAGLTLEGEDVLSLCPGDHLLIPAGRRHRVDWTDPDAPTVWLAVHISAA
jgi:cupin 2 domain-containing protein